MHSDAVHVLSLPRLLVGKASHELIGVSCVCLGGGERCLSQARTECEYRQNGGRGEQQRQPRNNDCVQWKQEAHSSGTVQIPGSDFERQMMIGESKSEHRRIPLLRPAVRRGPVRGSGIRGQEKAAGFVT